MKDAKFIELLNLYVDHQISAADAALLEAEIQKTPERRRVYRQYCQMQKACTTLAENFRADAPASEKVLEFPSAGPRRRFSLITYGMGFAAAAACVALVMVNRSQFEQQSALEAAPSVTVSTPAESSSLVAVNVPVAAAPARVTLQPAFAGLVRDVSRTENTLVNARSLEWMNQVQLERVPSSEYWFEDRPTLPTQDLTFRGSRAWQQPTEEIAFRFQR